MTSIETLARFFGWCTVLNIGLLLLVLLVWTLGKGLFSRVGATMFGVREEEVRVTVLRVFTQYRIVILTLNLVPYVALKIMA